MLDHGVQTYFKKASHLQIQKTLNVTPTYLLTEH